MADHKDATPGRRQRAQLRPFPDGGRDRLLHQNVLAPLERGLGEAVVRAGRCRDHDPVDAHVGERRLGFLRDLDLREPSPYLAEPPGVTVDDPEHLAPLAVVEVADEVGPPVAGPDHGHPDHLRSPSPT